MAENLPINFPVVGESSISSYSFTDFAQKVGYIRYYGSGDESGFSLLTEALDSTFTKAKTSVTSSASADTDLIDNDFDLTFNTPVTIGGNLLINTTVNWDVTSKVGTHYLKVRANVYKVVGVNETLIGSYAGAYFTVSAVTSSSYRHLMKIAVTDTLFNETDKLRVNIIVSGYGGAGNNITYILWHDPNSRVQSRQDADFPSATYGTVTNDTDLLVLVPFKIEL